MATQTYQEVSIVVLEELVKNPIFIKKINILDIHKHFYNLKNKNPDKYQRLFFDKNGHIPYSEDLNDMIMDFKMCEYLDYNNCIVSKNKERIINYLNNKEKR